MERKRQIETKNKIQCYMGFHFSELKHNQWYAVIMYVCMYFIKYKYFYKWEIIVIGFPLVIYIVGCQGVIRQLAV